MAPLGPCAADISDHTVWTPPGGGVRRKGTGHGLAHEAVGGVLDGGGGAREQGFLERRREEQGQEGGRREEGRESDPHPPPW